tara:strand:+ start:362 stop:1633 length:1272 start_codon:yes stop_codon:yes gene_type:complete
LDLNKKKICLIGLGYVGLPLAVAFAKKFDVVGYDIDKTRIQDLQEGNDKTHEIDSSSLDFVKSKIIFTSDIKDIKNCNIYIVTVPTPVDLDNKPDLKPLIDSSKSVGSVLNKNDIIIYESTVYPGVTENICVPVLEKSSGLVFNKDFFCGYSPERINPGDKERTITNIRKVTSGSTAKTAKDVNNLYKEIITAGTYLASSIRVAEASKVIENTQRDVNIALINELALIFDQMGLETNEVLDAAATKWNFIKFLPGLVGGHCIGVDPYYLTFKAEEIGYKPDLILAARQINSGMGKFIAEKTIKEMNNVGKVLKNSNILILGLAFKENCSDIRNTRVIDVIKELNIFGANIDIYDPWIDKEHTSQEYKMINDPFMSTKKYDAIIVAVSHKQFKKYNSDDYSRISTDIQVIMDIKNITKNPTWRL